jgi:cytochrome P450
MLSPKNATRAEFLSAREPSGPPPVTLLTLLRGRFRANPLERWTEIRERHGDVARYRFAGADTYLVTSADGVRRILQENVSNYSKRHLSYAMLRWLFGNGLFTSDGTAWLQKRRLAQPAFHKERIFAMGERMVGAALQTREVWEQRAARGEPVQVVTDMGALALRIAGDALFGEELGPDAAEIARAWETLNHQLADRAMRRALLPPVLPTAYDRAFRRARRSLVEIVDRIITRKRERGGTRADLLSLLMDAEDEETRARMTDAQLRDEVVTLLLAGHETTAMALSWIWPLLFTHSEVRARLDAELTEVLQGGRPTAGDYPRLRYTRAIVEETLRLYPPAYLFNRRAEGDDVVSGHRVRRGGSIIISPLILHRHPAYWPEPDRFHPERFLDAEAEKVRPRFAYLPFSGGPRQCIGNGFALLEAVLVLATLAQQFRPELVGPFPDMEFRVICRPSGDVPMALR